LPMPSVVVPAKGTKKSRSRKFFGTFDPATREYRVCVQLREDDHPNELGLEVGKLPGGRYLLVRLKVNLLLSTA
jgi:hypothetical protein